MNARQFLRGINNPALGARGEAILSLPQWEGIALEDLYQQVRDLYNEFSRINRLDLLPQVLTDYSQRLDLSVDDIAEALNLSRDQANALLIPPDPRIVRLRQLWAETLAASKNTVLFDPIGSAALALAQNMRDINASAAELASANNIPIESVNEWLERARIETERQASERLAWEANIAAYEKAQAEAARLAELQAQQATQQAATVTNMDETLDLERVLRESQVLFNNTVKAIRSKIAEIATARATGQSYALPVWSVDYPLIPADLVESLLAQFGQPTIAELEAELAASQAAATGVDQSRGIDATTVVTAPAAPSDTTAPVEREIFYEVPETTPPVETPAPATEVTAVEQYVFGDITLPQGWYGFTPKQKADWFNQKNVTPTRLRAAGVPDQDIIYLRQAGYTIQDATTVAPVSPVAPAAGNLLPLALAAAFVLFGG